jgi:GT2 family glycosyltransferase
VLSIAILNYETPDLTADCVRSILRTPPVEAFELVVVDNGSSEATLAELRALRHVRLVETGINGGFAAGVNRCVDAADAAADVIVVLNSDTQVEAGALDALACAVRRPGIGLSAPVLLDRHGRLQRSAHRRFPTLWTTWMALCTPLAYARLRIERILAHPTCLTESEHEAGTRPTHVMGAVMAFGRDAWDDVGPFDERFFMYLEETEWQRRLHEAGWGVELVPAARVLHLHRGGDEAVAVPPLSYLDSARTYFGLLGHRDRAIRAVLASSLLLSYVTLRLYAPFTRWTPAHRDTVRASLPLARSGSVHALRGRTVPRPGR